MHICFINQRASKPSILKWPFDTDWKCLADDEKPRRGNEFQASDAIDSTSGRDAEAIFFVIALYLSVKCLTHMRLIGDTTRVEISVFEEMGK